MAGNEKIIVELILKDKDFQKGIKDAVKDTQNLGKQGKSAGDAIATGFKVAAGAIAAMGLKELIVDLSKTAAQTQSVESAFKNSFDPSVLEGMRKAVNGTVDDLSLMQKALNAKNLKIPIDTLNAGLRLARQRAAETGESVEFLAQSVVLGLGRESALILDNLGISAKRLSDESQRTGNFMKAAASIINQELANAPETVSTVADGFAQMNAELQNIKGELSKELIPILLTVNKTALEYLKIINAIRQGQTPEEYQKAAEQAENFELQVSNLITRLKEEDNAREILKRGIDNLNASIDRTVRVYGETRAAARNAYKVEKLKIYQETLKRITQQANSAKTAIENIERVNGSVSGINPTRAGAATLNTARDPVGADMVEQGLKDINAMTLASVEAFQLAKFESMAFTQDLTNGLFDAAIAGETFNETMSKFIQNLILQFAKLITQALVFQAIMSATGGAGVGASSLFGAFFGIRGNASGTNMFGGGLTLVGEYGPELVSLPGGSSIASASKTAGMMGGGELYSKISGEDIYLSSKRYAVNRQR